MRVLNVALLEWPDGIEAGGPRLLGRTSDPEIVTKVQELLAASAASAVSVHVPEPFNDVCDFLRAGGSVRELMGIAGRAATEPPGSASDFEVSSLSPPSPEPVWPCRSRRQRQPG